MMKYQPLPKSLIAKFLQILLACLGTGLILSLFGLRAIDIIVFFMKIKRRVMDMGWGVFGYLWETLIMGALIIIPIVALFFVFKFLLTRQKDQSPEKPEQ